MDFDQLLVRFFGTDDIASLSPERLIDGVEALRLQFSLERNKEKRFELWCVLHMLGVAPDVDEAFKDEKDREAARGFIEVTERELWVGG